MTRLTLSLNATQKTYVDDLLRTGLYGKNVKECIQRLLEQRLQELVQDEFLEMKHAKEIG